MIERIGWIVIGILICHGFELDAWLPIITSLFIVTLTLMSCIGVGRVVYSKASWDASLAIGVGILGTAALPLAYIGLVRLTPVLFLVGFYGLYKSPTGFNIPKLSSGHWVIIGVITCGLIWNAQLPITDTDALYYHLALPKHFWLESQLYSGVLHPNASRPMVLHLVYTMVYGCSNIPTLTLFASLLSLGAWVSIIQMIEEGHRGISWVVWFLVLGSYTLLEQLTVVNSNMMVLWWCTLAFRHRRSDHIGMLGLFVGFAIAGKYTAVVLAGLIGLTSQTRRFVREALVAVSVILVWPLRNLLDGEHPVFPYLGWDVDMSFMYVEKYGMGRDWMSMLLLPWNVMQHAEIQSLQFMGRLSPAFWVCIVGFCLRYRHISKHWRVWTVLLASLIFWAVGPHWIRHLVPMMGLLMVCSIPAGAISRTATQLLIGLGFVLGVPQNIAPFLEQTYARGQNDTNVPGAAATEWLNQHVEDGSVALLFLWTGASLDVPYVLSSVEDHTPVRHWVLKHGDMSVEHLKSNGVRWVVVGPHALQRSAYPFIGDEEFQSDWQQPIANLEQLLSQQARWMTTQSGVDIYFLP